MNANNGRILTYLMMRVQVNHWMHTIFDPELFAKMLVVIAIERLMCLLSLCIHHIKLTALPPALSWSQVALLGMGNKQWEKRKDTMYICM